MLIFPVLVLHDFFFFTWFESSQTLQILTQMNYYSTIYIYPSLVLSHQAISKANITVSTLPQVFSFPLQFFTHFYNIYATVLKITVNTERFNPHETAPE